MSNPRFSMLNICSSLVPSLLCCFLWDSAKEGQVGLRENMLFSHTKNNHHHHLITAFRNTSVSCLRVGICYCHRCAFCCSHSVKTHTKSHQFFQIGILWKVFLPIHALKGCQSFGMKFSECPVHASAEPCQGLPDGAPRSLLRPLRHPLYQGDSWFHGGIGKGLHCKGFSEEEFAVHALEAAFVHYWAHTECLQLPSMGQGSPGAAAGIPSRGSGWDPWRWPFLLQGCRSAEPRNVHTNKTSVFSYLLCYWSRKSLAGRDWWYCAA